MVAALQNIDAIMPNKINHAMPRGAPPPPGVSGKALQWLRPADILKA
jgi:hypothetical protein